MMWNIFHMLICHLYIFSGEMTIHLFGPLLELFVFLLLSFRHLCIFWLQVFYQICVLQIFSPSLWLVFSFS